MTVSQAAYIRRGQCRVGGKREDRRGHSGLCFAMPFALESLTGMLCCSAIGASDLR